MDTKDEVVGARTGDGSRDGTASQTPEKDPTGTAKEAELPAGSESAAPRQTSLICCADGFDRDTFKTCKELLRPFKKSLRKLHFPQHLSREKKMKYAKESLTALGTCIDLFVQKYCRPSEGQHWQKMLWRFVSLFSEMDEKQLQKMHKYIKRNQMDKFMELCCPSHKTNLVPRRGETERASARQLGSLRRAKRPAKPRGQRDHHHQHTPRVTPQQQERRMGGFQKTSGANRNRLIQYHHLNIEQGMQTVSMVSPNHKLLKYFQHHSNSFNC